MARSAIHIVQHRRRREQKTDYALRLAMLKSGTPRLVVRKSNAYVNGQIVAYAPAGDSVKVQATSRELRALGWKHSCANATAAYLAGMLMGKRAKEAGVTDAVLDIGLQRSTKGNVLYAYLKGTVEMGLRVAHSPDMLPTPERATGKHINIDADFEALRKKIVG
ncbi:MAG: 50S ribosomal protein L18 [Candidatus Aenigmarchaeota archaeon]|nr:50S ribosomal protein L18 [Candidatus Aenigmarchaeota archaeon]